MTVEQRLQEIREREIPSHIGIIMDGNRRWAEARGLMPSEGHKVGAESVGKLVRFIAEELPSIRYLTLYAFSTENWKRSEQEVEFLMTLFDYYLNEKVEDLAKNGLVLRFLGHLSALPEHIQGAIDHAVRATEGGTRLTVNLAINYGGREEIATACRRIAEDVKAEIRSPGDITPDLIGHYLYTAGIEDPGLIVRTSGELRLSNFLLWQSAYAEFVSTETRWPDFGPPELLDALSHFQRRTRRFGGDVEMTPSNEGG